MSPLDQQWYLYQNPRTGTVSAAPLSLRQLIKLFCPPREGLPPILPSSTQCLAVSINQSDPLENKEVSGSAEVTQPQHQQSQPVATAYGEWKPATDIEILKQASCHEWYWTVTGSQKTHGPGSCRILLEARQQSSSPSIMVFAQGQTAEWTDINGFSSLQLALQALSESPEQTDTTMEITERPVNTTAEPLQQPRSTDGTEPNSQEVQDELEAFLSSTAEGMKKRSNNGVGNDDDDSDDDGHAYESDGGTQYIKDPRTGNWVHEALAPPEATARLKKRKEPTVDITATVAAGAANDPTKKKKKKKKSNFSKRNAKNWIYITGLPTQNVTTQDVQQYFAKAGMLDLDPETMQPKIKLYRDGDTNQLKGDASVCYARPESVELALQVLDDSLWDADHRIQVQRAQFQAKADNQEGNTGTNNGDKAPVIHNKRHVSEAQRKVARLALLQAQDDGFGERLSGGRKGLRIIVIKGMMQGIPENTLEDVLHEKLEQYGQVEKITAITKTQVVIVKYVEPISASEALEALHGSENPNSKQTMQAIYWDGVTDYTKAVGDEEKEKFEEEKRHEDFGNWLESQEELPPELRLQVAGEE